MSPMSLGKVALLTVALAFVVVVLGAYVRLNDAGLSCPDWPGCYGRLLVPAGEEAREAQALYPHVPLEHGKAWLEMGHRYLASLLGLLILVLFGMSFSGRRSLPGVALVISGLLVPLVIFQGALGMWTVTQLLNPAIVTAHLGGGMIILLLLWCLHLRLAAGDATSRVVLPGSLGLLRGGAALALLALLAQALLGGWTSANYAALACDSFPGCRGEFALPPLRSFVGAFQMQGGDAEVAAAIHMTHRLWAVVAVLALVALAWRAWRLDALRPRIRAMLLFLALQVAVAVAAVFQGWPLLLATLHNALAAALLLSAAGVAAGIFMLRTEMPRA